MPVLLLALLGGLVAVALGFSLYRSRQRNTQPPSHLRCVHRVTASGEPISFLLAPRDRTET